MAKVYMMNIRTTYDNNLLEKFSTLIEKSGFLEMNLTDKFVAIKVHFGEYGNLAYIKPQYARILGDLIKEKGGKPFLTDCSTLYSGSRSDAISHLNTATLNGWTYQTTGMENIIGDGLRGNDYKYIDVDLRHCSNVKIGSAIMEADIIISFNHVKGHEQAGFGGALKNLGMGCGSKLGKLEMHSGSKPVISEDLCIACKMCTKNCNQNAIFMKEKAQIDYEKCVGCGECIVVCPKKAIKAKEESQSKILNEKIAEYAYGVLKDRTHFHINFLTNISPNCDCWSNNDAPIVPDIGILASFDPVAIDMASCNLVKQEKMLYNTALSDLNTYAESEDKFKCMHGKVDWEAGLTYAEELKLGSKEYEIISIDK